MVLHHGQLREQGTHEQLLARGGLYARLHELQFAAGSAREEMPGNGLLLAPPESYPETAGEAV
jgi:hypothetical protein